MSVARRVVKVGGSLLDLADLRPRLAAWLAEQPPADTILLAGGGQLAEAVRQLDRLHSLGERDAHWLCIDAMTITARALRAMLPGSIWLDERGQWPPAAADSPRQFVADTGALLRCCPSDRELPQSWSVTSDSIAAWLAAAWGAQELVLLKSCPAPGRSLVELAGAGYVDPYFPRAAAGLPTVRLVNFRDDVVRELSLSQ